MKTVGFALLEDRRPANDRKYTKSIKDVPEKITAKLMEDFEKSKLFQEIHYPPHQGDDFVMTGAINRFKWKLYYSPIIYIPYLGLVMFLGVPVAEAYGITDIQIEIRDGVTNESVGKFSAWSEVKTPYTVYNVKIGEHGAELAESFRDVAKKLKQDIVSHIDDDKSEKLKTREEP